RANSRARRPRGAVGLGTGWRPSTATTTSGFPTSQGRTPRRGADPLPTTHRHPPPLLVHAGLVFVDGVQQKGKASERLRAAYSWRWTSAGPGNRLWRRHRKDPLELSRRLPREGPDAPDGDLRLRHAGAHQPVGDPPLQRGDVHLTIGAEPDRCAARCLVDLVLDDVKLAAERRPEHERVDNNASRIGEEIVAPTLDVVDAAEGGAARARLVEDCQFVRQLVTDEGLREVRQVGDVEFGAAFPWRHGLPCL